MSNAPYQPLITLADAYARHLNVSHWRVAFLVRGDGQFFKRLREGKGCTLNSYKRDLCTEEFVPNTFTGFRFGDTISSKDFAGPPLQVAK